MKNVRFFTVLGESSTQLEQSRVAGEREKQNGERLKAYFLPAARPDEAARWG